MPQDHRLRFDALRPLSDYHDDMAPLLAKRGAKVCECGSKSVTDPRDGEHGLTCYLCGGRAPRRTRTPLRR